MSKVELEQEKIYNLLVEDKTQEAIALYREVKLPEYNFRKLIVDVCIHVSASNILKMIYQLENERKLK